ncbi:MAG: hypothetical protein BWY42_00357 [Candidatus Omnitrophica bacterium ADurb.Bin277]|nr:MAG: hypothetical protein BWY42_00357 [Candidatus Omnitrophica bacterium ADurb.Bin277]
MKPGRTIVIFLLFIAVVAIYLYQTRLDKEILSISPDEVSRDVVLDPEERITGIAIKDKTRESEILLERSGDGWRISSPVDYPADSGMAEGLAMAARFASKQTRLRAEKDWDEYGLEKADLEVRIMTDRKKEWALVFGGESPVGRAVYARWLGERGYILAAPELKASFQASLYRLRDKRIFTFKPVEAAKVFIELGPNTYEWKNDGGKWYWIEPLRRFAKEMTKDRMDLVFMALAGFHVREFIDQEDRSDAELGFYIIHDLIRVTGDFGEEIFNFGNEIPAKNAYYGKRQGGDAVFLVERTKVIQLLDLLRALENEGETLDPNQKILPAGDPDPDTALKES